MLYCLIDAFAIVCTLVCVRQLQSWRKRRRSLPLPPGPKGLPLVGNIFDMPEKEVWETARQWAGQYGPLVHVKNFGTSLIFLNDYQSAVDLFEKRGANYSSRPRNVMMEIEGWEWFISIMPYGDELRRSRQLLHRFLHSSAVEEYNELQTQSTHRLLRNLLDFPNRYPELLRHSAGETILKMTYGYQVLDRDDPYIALAEKGLEAITEAEEFFLVNVFPWLQYVPAWVPGMDFKRIAERGYRYSMAMLHEPFQMAKASFTSGSFVPSMTGKLLEALSTDDPVINDELLIAKVAGTSYGAGADTTVSTLHSFFLAMVLYPDVQHRAQEELDRVIGKDILPSFDDRPNLPYVNAIVKEIMRWQVVAPFAVAHTADEDDVYDGYSIPAGATILPNLWAMLRDPALYHEPHEFIPERWIPTEGKEPPLDVHKIFFGIGRRVCPGRHFADNSIFIGVASILAAFNITKALDENGAQITPKVEYTTHFVRHPKPFEYKLVPRSSKIGIIIRQAVDSETRTMGTD